MVFVCIYKIRKQMRQGVIWNFVQYLHANRFQNVINDLLPSKHFIFDTYEIKRKQSSSSSSSERPVSFFDRVF